MSKKRKHKTMQKSSWRGEESGHIIYTWQPPVNMASVLEIMVEW